MDQFVLGPGSDLVSDIIKRKTSQDLIQERPDLKHYGIFNSLTRPFRLFYARIDIDNDGG